MSAKKKDAVTKELDLMDEVSLFDRIKKDGTITLDELMEELSKGGLKNIHFNEMSFNLEKFTLDNVEKTGFEENVDKILDDTLSHSIELENEEKWNESANTEICKKWWEFMAPIMETNPDNSPVSIDLQNVFHLD